MIGPDTSYILFIHSSLDTLAWKLPIHNLRHLWEAIGTDYLF